MAAPLDADEKIAAALGRMVGAWSHLESRLTFLFAMFTELDLSMAAALFDFYKSTRTQAEVMRRVSKLSSRSSAEVRAALSDALKIYQTLANKRNDLAHNPFGWTDEDTGDIYLMQKTRGPPSPKGIPYRTRPVTVDEINGVRSEVDALGLTFLAIIDAMPPRTFARIPTEPPQDISRLGLLSSPTPTPLQVPLRPPPKPQH